MHNITSVRSALTRSTLGSLLILSVVASPLAVADTAQGHAAENLQEINIANGFADLVQAVKPAVVNISVTGTVSESRRGPGIPGQQSPELEEFFKRFFGEEFNNAPNGDSNTLRIMGEMKGM